MDCGEEKKRTKRLTRGDFEDEAIFNSLVGELERPLFKQDGVIFRTQIHFNAGIFSF
jgi:hypothetical protein